MNYCGDSSEIYKIVSVETAAVLSCQIARMSQSRYVLVSARLTIEPGSQGTYPVSNLHIHRTISLFFGCRSSQFFSAILAKSGQGFSTSSPLKSDIPGHPLLYLFFVLSLCRSKAS